MKPDSKYYKPACKIIIVVLAALFGCILNAFAMAEADPSLGWIFFLAVPAGVVDLLLLVSTFRIMWKLDRGKEN